MSLQIMYVRIDVRRLIIYLHIKWRRRYLQVGKQMGEGRRDGNTSIEGDVSNAIFDWNLLKKHPSVVTTRVYFWWIHGTLIRGREDDEDWLVVLGRCKDTVVKLIDS